MNFFPPRTLKRVLSVICRLLLSSLKIKENEETFIALFCSRKIRIKNSAPHLSLSSCSLSSRHTCEHFTRYFLVRLIKIAKIDPVTYIVLWVRFKDQQSWIHYDKWNLFIWRKFRYIFPLYLDCCYYCPFWTFLRSFWEGKKIFP